jgi:hypothetical protein
MDIYRAFIGIKVNEIWKMQFETLLTG